MLEARRHFTKLERSAKDLGKDWHQLVSTDFQAGGRYAIRSWSLSNVLSLKEPAHVFPTNAGGTVGRGVGVTG